MCVVTLVAHMKCVWGKLFLALTILPETLGSQSVQCAVSTGRGDNIKHVQSSIVCPNLLRLGNGNALYFILVCRDCVDFTI